MCRKRYSKDKFYSARAWSAIYLNDLYILKESNVNDTSQVVTTPNHAFCLVHDIWQLVDMIQRFLFSCYEGIYEWKLVNSLPVDPYSPGQIFLYFLGSI